jgi:formylglycine-generating enzyme required for sulfatase activity
VEIGQTMAGRKSPVPITPWYGATRGFSFTREVQPVLDKYCIGCHDGSASEEGTVMLDLRAKSNVVWAYRHGDPDLIRFEDTPLEELAGRYSGLFPQSYVALRKQIRVGGLESDLHLLPPMEFHADTSRLVQMLKKGHHGVQLGPEAWDRLVTWIDLNAPCHGTWSEFTPIRGDQAARRCELRARYGGRPENGETIVNGDPPFGGDLTPVVPPPQESASLRSRSSTALVAAATENARGQANSTRQESSPNVGNTDYLDLNMGDGVTMRLVRIPAGRGPNDLSIDRPFWMGCFEVTNRQYAQINPEHDSRFEHRGSWVFSEEYLGWPLNAPKQPVVRVSWEEADAFCRELSERTGRRVRLPREQEWEYACRAGAASPFWFGAEGMDYTSYANLADRSLRRLATDSWNPRPPDLVARDERFNDGHLVTADVGSFAPNPFGLYDMHGNVAEWTIGRYDSQAARKSVRGGSWRDLPQDAHASARIGYYRHQKVFNVGFRVVVEDTRMDAAPPSDTYETSANSALRGSKKD